MFRSESVRQKNVHARGWRPKRAIYNISKFDIYNLYYVYIGQRPKTGISCPFGAKNR